MKQTYTVMINVIPAVPATASSPVFRATVEGMSMYYAKPEELMADLKQFLINPELAVKTVVDAINAE